MPKYDVIIKSAEKDYVKIPYVLDSIKWLNPQPENVYLVTKDAYFPPDYTTDYTINIIKDDDVFPDLDRNKIPYRKDWLYAMFIALFQNFTKNDYYLDIQADNFFINPVELFNAEDKPYFFVSPQHQHYHQPYFTFQKKVLHLSRTQDKCFISDFMMYKKSISKEMIFMYDGLIHLFNASCNFINEDCYPADQEIFAHWVLEHRPDDYVIKDGVNTLVLGKNYPQNFTSNEILEAITSNYSPELTAISCHTWKDGVLGRISLVKDTINRDDINALVNWLNQEPIPKLTKGALTRELEEKWAAVAQTTYSTYVNSGSSAILLLLAACKELYGYPFPKIVVPAVSWATDVSSPMLLGFNVLLCDCNLEDLSCDLNHLEYLFKTEHPEFFLSVAPLGLVPKMKTLITLCQKYNVKFLEDNCESMGSKYRGRMLGSFGLASVFSLFYGHHISTLEGGLINTSDAALNRVIKSMRSHGWDRDWHPERQQKERDIWGISEFDALYTFYYPGLNVRATDLQAFIGLRQVDNLSTFAEVRNRNFFYYLNGIKENMLKLTQRDGDFTSSFAYPILSANREKIVANLALYNVESRPLIAGNIAKQPFWLKKHKAVPFQNADLVHKYGFYLPNHPGLTKENIDYVIELVNNA